MRFLCLILCFGIHLSAHSQRYGVLKTNLTNPFLRRYGVALEYGVKNISIQIAGEAGSYYSMDSKSGDSYKNKGWAIAPEIRHYPWRTNEKKFQPFYGGVVYYGPLKETYSLVPGGDMYKDKGTLVNYRLNLGTGFIFKRFWAEGVFGLNYSGTKMGSNNNPPSNWTYLFLSDQKSHLRLDFSFGYFIYRKKFA